jgi:hypothetical protein
MRKRIIEWTAEMDEVVRTATIRAAMAQLKLTHAAVFRRRRELKMPRQKCGRKPVEWTPEMDADLETLSDRRLATKYHISREPVTRRRKELGTPDVANGRPAKVPRQMIGAEYLKVILDEDISLTELAARLGKSVSGISISITRYMKRLDDPGYKTR